MMNKVCWWCKRKSHEREAARNSIVDTVSLSYSVLLHVLHTDGSLFSSFSMTKLYFDHWRHTRRACGDVYAESYSQRSRRLKVRSNSYSRNLIGQLELISVNVRSDFCQRDVWHTEGFNVGECRSVCILALAKFNWDFIYHDGLNILETELGYAFVQIAGELVAGILEALINVIIGIVLVAFFNEII